MTSHIAIIQSYDGLPCSHVNTFQAFSNLWLFAVSLGNIITYLLVFLANKQPPQKSLQNWIAQINGPFYD